jgi:pimeloyl-ACP methyl ester carboxylesterase
MARLRIACCLLLVTLVAVPGRTTQSRRPEGPPPGTLIDLGSHKLHLACVGSGSPAVILEAGAGNFSDRWAPVQAIVSKRLRTCAYDRAGSGWSEEGPDPRTMRQEVFELHAMLQAARVAGPYLLVGHSYGGLLVRLYADKYPGDVAGVVLVDPTHESTRLSVQRRGEATASWIRIREGATGLVVPEPRATKSGPPSESPDYWAEELQQMHDARARNPQPLGDRPLIVLAGTRPSAPPGDTPEALWTDLVREKLAQKADLARLSRNGRLIEDPASGHHIHTDNPRLVASAITDAAAATAKR